MPTAITIYEITSGAVGALQFSLFSGTSPRGQRWSRSVSILVTTTTFLCGLGAGFVEGGVVCVPSSLLEELHIILFLSSLICFSDSCAFVNHGIDELIVH